MVNFISLPTEDLMAPATSTIGAIQGAGSFAELIQSFDELRQEGHLMLVLEEGDQMFYTASHAGEHHFEVADIDYEDDDAAFEAALAADRRAQLEKEPLAWSDLSEALPVTEEGVAVIEKVNRDLDLLVDPYHCVQQLPERSPLAWLADQPNGYFAGDLTPQQVLALCTRIEATTPYRLLGMGGNFVGFRKGAEGVDKPALQRDLAHVFGAALDLPFGEFLILPYTESADQYLDRMQ